MTMAVEDVVQDVLGLTGRYGEIDRVRSSIRSVIASLHSRTYFIPDLRSGVVAFDKPYRTLKVRLTPDKFGQLRKLKQVRHCAESPTGLPLGARIPKANFDDLVYQTVTPGDYYSIENSILHIRSVRPVTRIWISWYAYPTVTDPAEDWIFQRYPELIKLMMAGYLEGTFGAGDKKQGYEQLASPMLNALMADNADSDAES